MCVYIYVCVCIHMYMILADLKYNQIELVKLRNKVI